MMKEKACILPLNSKCVSQIIKIVRNSFKPDYLFGSIYRSKGIYLFIKYELENPFSPYEYRTLLDSYGEITCFAEFKKYSNFLFLNMIATPSNSQSKGAASQLLGNCINDYFVRGFKYMYLDVFDSNKIALKWYHKLGFKNISEKWLLKINSVEERGSVNSALNLRLLNYSQTKALLDTYGFGMLEYTKNETVNKIGIIEEDIILNNDAAISDMGSIIEIKKEFRKENIYIFSDHKNIPGTKVLDSIQRLKLDLNDYKNSQ